MQDKRIKTAYHEAGHTVAYLLTNRRFKYVTIKPNKKLKSLGHILTHGPTIHRISIGTLNLHAIRLMAGGISEGISADLHNEFDEGGSFEDALALTKLCDGFIDNDTINHFLTFISLYTSKLLESNWDKVDKVASALLERETLTYDEVLNLLYPEII